MQEPITDLFGNDYAVGDIILYAKTGGLMVVYRIRKINEKSRTLTAYPIGKDEDGMWRERNGTKSVLSYPRMGYIISTDVFPFTETPLPPKPVPRSVPKVSHSYWPDEDDED